MSKHLKEYYSLVESIKNTYNASEIDEIKKNADIALSKHIDFMNASNKLIESIGEKNNFGDLKLIFESMCPELFKIDSGRKLINKYINMMKSNQDLKSLTVLHENVMNPNTDYDLSLTIIESLNSMPAINKRNMRKYISNILPLMSEAINIIGIETAANVIKITDQEKSINESLDKLIFTKRNMNNVSNRIELSRNLANFMKESYDNRITKEAKALADIEKIICNNNETLNEDVVKTFDNSEFLNEQTSCIEMLDNLIEQQKDADLRDRLKLIKERVGSMECVETNQEEYINKIKTIKQTLITQ